MKNNSKPQTTEPNKFNITLDPGHLLVYDSQPFKKEDITEEDILTRVKNTFRYFIAELIKLSNSQKGEEDEKRDFDKAEDNVKLPAPVTVLPRAKPIPKPKALTKWERYREEKGLGARQKRGRMIYSELANDWVPRWGKGSSKQLDEKADWAIEEKPGMEGMDPFAIKKQQKSLSVVKQQKREEKNIKNSKNDNSIGKGKGGKLAKGKKELESLQKDKQGLAKTLERVQKSTGSMGNFDKKLKNEKELNKIKKKKVDSDVMLNRKHERERDKSILDNILRKKK